MNHLSNLTNHKQKIARTFNRAAATYSTASFLEKELGNRLLERLGYMKFKPSSILDLGGGTGFFTNALLDLYPHSLIYNLDFAEKLLEQTDLSLSLSRICADVEALPFKNQSMNLVFSNLVLHWLETTRIVFKEVRSILKPGGLFLFSMLGPDTLQELRASFLSIDPTQHVNHFTDMHLIGDALLEAGFHDPVMDRETLTITYPTVSKLLADLKSSGSSYVLRPFPSTFSEKTLFQEMSNAYEKFRDEMGKLPATIEILYGQAWTHPETNLYPISVCRSKED